jgi:catechol 2,3-dioxygenase-like lactoylglutathione lyase family enzyme
MASAHFILYVKDQVHSTAFYSQVLACSPTLEAPGMTEFSLTDRCVLGLMPETSIQRLVEASLPDPAQASGIPRAELYLLVDNPQSYHRRAVAAGALELSCLAERAWGHRVAYSLDPDGHVLAFAEPIHAESESRENSS